MFFLVQLKREVPKLNNYVDWMISFVISRVVFAGFNRRLKGKKKALPGRLQESKGGGPMSLCYSPGGEDSSQLPKKKPSRS